MPKHERIHGDDSPNIEIEERMKRIALVLMSSVFLSFGAAPLALAGEVSDAVEDKRKENRESVDDYKKERDDRKEDYSKERDDRKEDYKKEREDRHEDVKDKFE
jgi:hypothetical protein